MATVSHVESDRRANSDVRPGPVRHRLTVADHYRMAEAGILGRRARVELIDGEIIDMLPIGVLHAAVVNVLARHVAQCLGDATFVSIQNPLRLDDENEPEPDLLMLRPRSDCYCMAHPGAADTLVVIEVSDMSLAYDFDVKVPLYARHGVPEVWVIDVATRRTHVFRAPEVNANGTAGYADARLIEADQSLPFAAIAAADAAAVDASLAQLLPAVS